MSKKKKKNIEDESQLEGMTLKDVVNGWVAYLKNWFYDLNIVVGFIDVINYLKFKKEFDEEEEEDETKYNKYHLKRNKLKNIIYTQWNFSDTDLMYADYDSNRMYMKKVEEITKYLTVDMGWGEYLDIDVSNFRDENGDPSLSYVFMFRYVPKVFSFRSLFKWLGILLGVGGIVWLIVYVYGLLLMA